MIDPVGEALAFHELHLDVGVLPLLSEAVDPGDVRMLHAGHRARLGKEAIPRVLVGRHSRGEKLDRNQPLELPVPRKIDRPHAALAERSQDLEGLQIGQGSAGQSRLAARGTGLTRLG